MNKRNLSPNIAADASEQPDRGIGSRRPAVGTMRRNFRRGFTLIELLVVVLIVGILAAVALPQYEKAVYSARMAEVETMLTAVHHARQVHQLATGESVPLSYDELDIALPAHCQEYALDSSGQHMGWKCGKYVVYMATATTLATVSGLGGCAYCHFDKLYPSGEFRCREKGTDTLFAQYCRNRNYRVDQQ